MIPQTIGECYENQESIAGDTPSRGGVFGTPQNPQKPGSVKAYGDKYAIVIGISDYKDLKSRYEETISGKIVDLKYAEKDAIDIIKFLCLVNKYIPKNNK